MRIHIFGILINDTACVIEKIEDTCHDLRVVAILDLSNGGACRLEVLILCHAKIKYDACRILATCYKENGQVDLIEPTLEMIPEIYFSKLELMASLLDGEDSYEAAQKQKNISAEDLIDMLMIAGKYLKSRGENEKASSQFRIAKKIMDAFSEDFVERKWFNSTVYERTSDRRAEIEKLLNE